MKSATARGFSLLVEKYNLDSWKNLNNEIARALAISTSEIQAYLGLHHALKEITTGLSHLFMHKMAIGVVSNCDFFVDQVTKDFSKLGYKVQSTPSATLMDPKAWVDSLSKDTLLVMFAEDHPITGEIFKTSELRGLLAAKKIFSISVSHRLQFYSAKPQNIESHEVRIWAAGVGRAVALLGERVKINTPIASHFDWDQFSRGSFDLPVKQAQENKTLVSNFEKTNFENCAPFFKADENRMFDRAVLVWNDLDAAALIDTLTATMKLSGGSLVTTSACHWASPKLIEWLRGNPLSDVEQRGLVVFSLEFLGLEKAVEQIKLARAHVLILQG